MDNIQWYPGHMAKAMRLMKEALSQVDGVIMVLDARCPFACMNEKLNEMFANKSVLFVLNKADLIERKDLNAYIEKFVKLGKNVIALNAKNKGDVASLYSRIFEVLKDKVERNANRGYFKPVRVMVAGIPNTGKSTIINALSGAKKAQVGDKAGVTRSNQWIKLDKIELLDTPGTTPPSFENQEMARHLAYIGSINDEIMDLTELCLCFLEEMNEKYPEKLKERYKLSGSSETPLEIYEEICKNRGFLVKKGEYDYERCAKAVIDDLRSQKIGKIAFE
ncbi:MAG: ribosome biogenesis GTPase YlqF [Clostridia bacterium]|nr:ribosome biogenesis GTPase YlqF [Clostridia bacterium]